MIKKITDALSRPVCGGWDRGFLGSILEQLSKGHHLSAKQKQTLGMVLARNTVEDQAKHENWVIGYEKEYKEDAMVLAYYHSRQPYYRPMAADIKAGNVPERSKFMRMYNNKYSKKVLIEQTKGARYSIGDYVMPRSNFNSFKNIEMVNTSASWPIQNASIEKFKGRGGFILGIEKHITTHAKGAKRYRILAAGGIAPFIVEERFLKIAKK